jgi:hypothetical protein
VAESVFEDFVRESDLIVHRDEWLDRVKGVKKSSRRITSLTTLSGKTYAGKMFIDAAYEGDLMAAAGVDYHVGREASSVYGEEWNSNQVGILHRRHHFGVLERKVSPYVVPGDPASGLLCRHRAPRCPRGGRQAGPSVLFPDVPDERSRQPRAAAEARGL